ncbi:hypothetical protein J4409_00255, partial [Candidatus Woesearchaeota archaeon]|nr:hypothetical protein [Candidatus Woesearchaeota archaeon]
KEDSENCRNAISIYQKIVREADETDLRAEAQFSIGETYEKWARVTVKSEENGNKVEEGAAEETSKETKEKKENGAKAKEDTAEETSKETGKELAKEPEKTTKKEARLSDCSICGKGIFNSCDFDECQGLGSCYLEIRGRLSYTCLDCPEETSEKLCGEFDNKEICTENNCGLDCKWNSKNICESSQASKEIVSIFEEAYIAQDWQGLKKIGNDDYYDIPIGEKIYLIAKFQLR